MLMFLNRILLILMILISSNLYAKENYIFNWDKLIPENAYSFIPSDGGSDELWQNKNFLKKIDAAGLKFNKKIIGRKIKLYGFMVPLKTDYKESLIVSEFVLVPTAGMCIHVPPPPPNQMIYVKLKKPERVRYIYNPIAIEGILKNTPPIKEIYDSIYEISTEKIVDVNQSDYIKHYEDFKKINPN